MNQAAGGFCIISLRSQYCLLLTALSILPAFIKPRQCPFVSPVVPSSTDASPQPASQGNPSLSFALPQNGLPLAGAHLQWCLIFGPGKMSCLNVGHSPNLSQSPGLLKCGWQGRRKQALRNNHPLAGSIRISLAPGLLIASSTSGKLEKRLSDTL